VEQSAVKPAAELGNAAVDLLCQLLRFDTSNPPGNERPLQELLAELLGDAGFNCVLEGAEPDRPNLIARLEGERPGPTLCVLGHADTVPADPSEWSFDPWAGDVVDGEVRGRGAIDMKGQVAAEAAGVAQLAREGWRPASGELLMVVTVDEEAGVLGAKWLCEERPELVRADFAVNEAGGAMLEFGGKRLYPVAMGEKGIFRLLLRARGTAGHASLPRIGDNALLRLAPILARMRQESQLDAEPEALELLAALGAGPADLGDGDPEAEQAALREALERVRASSAAIADYLLEPMMSVTMSPTVVSASRKENVIPSVAEVLVDTRAPPERGEAHVRAEIERVLGPGVEPEFTIEVVGNRSPSQTSLRDAIDRWLERADPEAETVPIVMPGFSDSHWFRKTFGTVAYGFWPRRAMPFAELEPLIHSADERVKASDMEFSAGFFWELPQLVLG
jgi:acetylornithine deacetylase/succinyl-diaminopimelate desuccinylase-like protein